MSKLQKWLKFRKAFLKGKKNFEGYYICQHCGRWLENIEVDHIKGRGSHPELVFDKNNLQLLCNSCHRKKTG